MLWLRKIRRELSHRRPPYTPTLCTLVTRYTLAVPQGFMAPQDAPRDVSRNDAGEVEPD